MTCTRAELYDDVEGRLCMSIQLGKDSNASEAQLAYDSYRLCGIG